LIAVVMARGYDVQARRPSQARAFKLKEGGAESVIRVAYLINDLETGGAETQLLHFLRHVDQARLQPSVIYLFGNGTLAPEIRRMGIDVHTVGLSRWNVPLAFLRLLRLVRRLRPRVLHLHLRHATVLGMLLARILGIRCCAVTRHFLDVGKKGPVPSLERRLLRDAARVIAVSGSVREVVLGLPAIQSDRVVTIPNGLDLEWFDKQADEVSAEGIRPAREEGEMRLGALANWRGGKGLSRLLEIFSILRGRVPQLRLWVGGAAAPASENRGVEGVVWWGPIPHEKVPAFLRSVDVFVHPASREAFGMSVLEAMAAGRPVVATSTGGMRELIVHEETGYLVGGLEKEGGASSIASAVTGLLSDPALAEAMGRRGRERVEESFSIAETVRMVEALYDEICSTDVRR
jgi:glycosyltransferase involved in cell wall biosynthesis